MKHSSADLPLLIVTSLTPATILANMIRQARKHSFLDNQYCRQGRKSRFRSSRRTYWLNLAELHILDYINLNLLIRKKGSTTRVSPKASIMIARALYKDSNRKAFVSKTVCLRNMSQLIWIRRPFQHNNSKFSANLRCIRITLEI